MQLCSPAPFGLNNAQECNSNKHLTQSRHSGNRSSRPKSCRPKLSPNASGILIPESRKIYSCGIRNLEKKLLVESRILGFEIQNKTLGIRNPTSLRNPETKIWYPVPEIRTLWLGIQNPILSWIPLHGAKIGSLCMASKPGAVNILVNT